MKTEMERFEMWAEFPVEMLNDPSADDMIVEVLSGLIRHKLARRRGDTPEPAPLPKVTE